MDLAAYERIWEKSIKPKIERMLLADNDIVFTEGQVKQKIWLTYEDCKNRVHSYMHNPDGLIDRHKVASVMLFSIIHNKPFELKLLSNKQEVNSSALLANEILGFNTALAIVWSFIIEDANKKSDKTKIEIFKKGFVFPRCQHDSYEATIYKMLYYSKYNNCYDIFAFAQILFLIEAYTEFVNKTELAGIALQR
jgi:hypothetical protein